MKPPAHTLRLSSADLRLDLIHQLPLGLWIPARAAKAIWTEHSVFSFTAGEHVGQKVHDFVLAQLVQQAGGHRRSFRGFEGLDLGVTNHAAVGDAFTGMVRLPCVVGAGGEEVFAVGPFFGGSRPTAQGITDQ